ncbi:MAG: 30S ribosomal protein S8 [Candidatus Micrarchaeota archaeon]
MDSLANAMNSLKTNESRGNAKARIKPASKVIRGVLMILQKQGFIGEFEFIDDGKSGEFEVKLVGKINNCGVVKPRFPVSVSAWERFETRFLPARGYGLLLVSTSQGLMTHEEAKEKGIGGRLLCFVY